MHYNKKKVATVLSLCLMMVLIFGLTACSLSGTNEKYGTTGFAMGTTISETVYAKDEEAATKACEDIISLLEKIENEEISWRVEGSEIYQINHSDQAFKVSDEVYDWLKESMQLAADSKMALNPAVGVLAKLWDIGGDNPRVPEKEEIAEALKKINADDIIIEESHFVERKNEDVQIDLGAVGKGIGADKVYQYLQEDEDISGAVIAVGGSICIYGEKADGSDWNVGVQDPRAEDGTVMGVVTAKDGEFVSTSGDYEKYIEQDGKRYHHILDSKSGYPSESGLISVTIICPSGIDSDGLSTACFVLGIEDSLALLEKYDAEAIFVDEDHNVYQTDGANFSLQNSDDYQMADLPQAEK